MFSILAGCLAAVILIPEVYALGLTASSGVSFPKKLTQYFSIVTVISRHLANTEVCIGLEHLPNIYCGVGVLLLFPLYVFNKKIRAWSYLCIFKRKSLLCTDNYRATKIFCAKKELSKTKKNKNRDKWPHNRYKHWRCKRHKNCYRLHRKMYTYCLSA